MSGMLNQPTQLNIYMLTYTYSTAVGIVAANGITAFSSIAGHADDNTEIFAKPLFHCGTGLLRHATDYS